MRGFVLMSVESPKALAVTSAASLCRAISAALDKVRFLCVLVCSVAMVVLITIFAWLVFGRYVLNETPTQVEQISLVLICYIVFLGAAAGVRDNTHLGVTFIREALPRWLRRILRVVAELAMAGFGLVMLLSCWQLVLFGWGTLLPMLNLPEGIRTLPAAICGGLVFLFASARAIAMIHKYWIAPPPPELPSETPPEPAGG